MTLRSLVLAIALAAPVAVSPQSDPPKPAFDLKAGISNYKTRLEINGRIVPVDVTHTVKSQNGAWVVSEIVKIASYVATDSEIVEKKTLISRARMFHDETKTVDLKFAGRMAMGTVTSKGEVYRINLDIGGVVFADGAGGPDVVAALPLAQGYTAEFSNFDSDTQRVTQMQLRVLGTDTVTVPAGTFMTWKVLTISADGGPGNTAAVWIDKKSRRVVKLATTLLQRNEWIATEELTK
jgi:hypothetical protein